MRQIWPYGRAVKLRRDWCSPNTPDFNRGYVSIRGQENGWALGLGAPAVAQSPRPSLLRVPTSHTQRGPCAASDRWVFGGGSHSGLPWWLRWWRSHWGIFNMCHWSVAFKLKRHIEELAVLPRESYMEAWPPHVNRCRSVRRLCWPGLSLLPRRQEELNAEWDSYSLPAPSPNRGESECSWGFGDYFEIEVFGEEVWRVFFFLMYFAFPVCLIRAPPKWNGGELLFPCVCNHVERPCDSTGDELADQGKIEQSPAHHRSTFFFFWPRSILWTTFCNSFRRLNITLALSDRCYIYWFLHTDDVGSQALYHFWLLILKYGPLTRKCLSLFVCVLLYCITVFTLLNCILRNGQMVNSLFCVTLLCLTACGIFVSWAGIEPSPLCIAKSLCM